MKRDSLYTHHLSAILRVLVYVEEHLDESLTLDRLAKVAAVSPYHFHRLFQACMGETVASYIKRLRMQHAAGRLQWSDLPVTKIALDSGYETPSSFTRVFNQVMGTSPRRYRDKMKPRVREMMQRTFTSQEGDMLQPEFVTRQEKAVLFVRRIGDYNETPSDAFKCLGDFLREKGKHDCAIAFYGMGLDHPDVVGRANCRFDACVAVSGELQPEGEVGQKVLDAGRYAVFEYKGPYSGLEEKFVEIFRDWYPNSGEELADRQGFCEHVNLTDKSLSDEERITKIYIPLE